MASGTVQDLHWHAARALVYQPFEGVPTRGSQIRKDMMLTLVRGYHFKADAQTWGDVLADHRAREMVDVFISSLLCAQGEYLVRAEPKQLRTARKNTDFVLYCETLFVPTERDGTIASLFIHFFSVTDVVDRSACLGSRRLSLDCL